MKLEGFQWWRVATVVAAVPLLLQSALGLFALGLVELLWNLHATVAIVVLIPTGAAVLFYTLTTLLPGIQAMNPSGILQSLPQCPFKSPQAMLAMQALALQRPAYKFLYRKCFVFLKRAYAFLRPASFWGHDDVPTSLWLRLRTVWLANESSFYRRSSDRLNFHRQLQEIGPIRSPLFKEMESWLRVDQAFIASEDATRFYFRALSWLRDHVHQPAMESWIFLSIWDCAAVHSDILEAIRDILPSAIRYLRGHCLAELLVLYGHHVRLEPGFVSEAFIHHLPSFQSYPEDGLFDIFYQHTVPPDGGTMFPALHGMLTRDLVSNTDPNSGLIGLNRFVGNPWPGLRPFVLSLADVFDYQSSNLHSAYACFVALYLRDLRTEGLSLYEDRDSLYVLLDAATTCMRSNAAPGEETPASAGTQAIFQFLALSVDRCFEQLRHEGGAEDYDYNFASQLVASRSRGAYLALLSSALGSTAVAREHLERNVVPLSGSHNAMWRNLEGEAATDIVSVELAGISGQGSSSETIEHTEAQLAGSQPEAVISTGVTAAAQSAHVATVAQAAAAAHDTDVPWVSEGSP